LYTTGVSEAADLAFRAIINPGDEVYSPGAVLCFLQTQRFPCRRKPIAVPTFQINEFRVTAEQNKKENYEKDKAVV